MTDDPLAAIRDVFDGRAPVYDESVMHRELANAVADFVELDHVHDVLDVATGTGLVLRALHDRAAGLEMVGTDISPGMLAVARDALPRTTWIEADAAVVPLPDSSVDLITCVTALHIIPDTVRAVAEWQRMLRPGGRVVTATFLRDGRQPGPVKYRSVPVDHDSFDSVETLRATFASQGFAVIRHSEWREADTAILIAELRVDR